MKSTIAKAIEYTLNWGGNRENWSYIFSWRVSTGLLKQEFLHLYYLKNKGFPESASVILNLYAVKYYNK